MPGISLISSLFLARKTQPEEPNNVTSSNNHLPLESIWIKETSLFLMHDKNIFISNLFPATCLLYLPLFFLFLPSGSHTKEHANIHNISLCCNFYFAISLHEFHLIKFPRSSLLSLSLSYKHKNYGRSEPS